MIPVFNKNIPFRNCGNGKYLFTTNVPLKGARFIELKVRSVDGKQSEVPMTFSIRVNAKLTDHFERMIPVSGKETLLSLPLEGTTDSRKGFVNKLKPTLIKPFKQGTPFSVTLPAHVELLHFSICNASESDRAELAELKKKIKTHPLRKPYVFTGIRKNGKKFDFIKNNRTKYKILLPESPHATVAFAAEELQKYVKAKTGPLIPVIHKKDKAPVIALQVKKGVPTEGFEIEVKSSGDIWITGNSERALLYGVYDFLEKACGVRFYGPTEIMTLVPQKANVVIRELKDVNAPVFEFRQLHYCADYRTVAWQTHMRAMADWCVKQRYNIRLARIGWSDREQAEFEKTHGGTIVRSQRGIHGWIPPSSYFKHYPKFYCWDASKKKWEWYQKQLCSSNDRLAREFAKKADRFFRDNPSAAFFPMFTEDIHRWCECPECSKLIFDPAVGTDRNLQLLNRAWKEIKKKHPDKGISSFAYAETEQLPKFVKPDPAINIMFVYHALPYPAIQPYENHVTSIFARWCKILNGNVSMYYYNYLYPYYPMTACFTIPSILRMAAIYNVRSLCEETREVWAGAELLIKYLSARLSWDPWVNEEDLIKDYFSGLYGEAAAEMRRVHELLDHAYSRRTNLKVISYFSRPALYPAEKKELKQLLETAARKVRYSNRAACAVDQQRRHCNVLLEYSDLYDSIDNFHKNPTEDNYKKTMALLEKCVEMAAPLSAERLYGHSRLSRLEYYRKIINRKIGNVRVQKQLSKGYRVVANLVQWKFNTDPKNDGLAKRITDPKTDISQWETLQTGKTWELQGYDGYDGYAWYAIDYEIPANGDYALYFHGADERVWVYMNGKYIGGHHEGDPDNLYSEPFLVKLPAERKNGKQRIMVRVHDSLGAGGFYRAVQLLKK